MERSDTMTYEMAEAATMEQRFAVFMLRLIAGSDWTRESICTCVGGREWAMRERAGLLDESERHLELMRSLAMEAADLAWARQVAEAAKVELGEVDAKRTRASVLGGEGREGQTLADAGPSGSPGAGVRIGLHGSGPDWGGA